MQLGTHMHATWRAHACNLAHACMQLGARMHATWRVHACNLAHACMQLGACMHATWCMHACNLACYHTAFRHGITFNFQPHALPEYLNTEFQSVKTFLFTPIIIISQPSITMPSPYSNTSFFDDPSDIE